METSRVSGKELGVRSAVGTLEDFKFIPNKPEALKLPLQRSSQDVSWDICTSQGNLGVQTVCVQILGFSALCLPLQLLFPIRTISTCSIPFLLCANLTVSSWC